MPFDSAFDADERAMRAAMRRRSISEERMCKFEADVAAIFEAFGLHLDTPATVQTPQRFLRALFDATEGYEGDPKLLTVFDIESREGADCQLNQIIEGPVYFFSLCEHHALPFHGKAYVGYVARESLIGLSKLTRIVRLFAKRFTVQERVGQQIIEALDAMLQPLGVAVYLEAHHLCTQMRGVREITPLTRTTFWRGCYNDDAALREEFFEICGVRQ